MINRYAPFLKAINLVVDYMLLNLSFIMVYIVFENSFASWANNKNYLSVVLILNLLWLLASNLTNLYDRDLQEEYSKTYHSTVKTYLLYLSLICFILLFIVGSNTYFITREYLIYSLANFGLFICLWKIAFIEIRRGKNGILKSTRNVIIVGASRGAKELYNQFKNKYLKGYNVVGFFADEPSSLIDTKLYLGKTSACMDYVLKNRIDEIFCALPSSQQSTIKRLIADSDKNLIRFKMVPDYYDYVGKSASVQILGNVPVLTMRVEPLENISNRFIKRLFDIVFSLFVIVFIFSWLFPVLAILIKLESPGPIFFVQARSGRDNNPFDCFKFRSMCMNKEADLKQATLGDSRITKIGAFLRKTSLDELPQFFNVLIGNMSVVGPRPHMLSHTKQYSELIDQFMVRHFMKPGITGWAQINGLRGETRTTQAMLERVEADVWYMENWTFMLDLKIVLLTFWKTIVGDKNAY